MSGEERRAAGGPDTESARGLAQMEGYLLWNAEVEQAHRLARRFTDQLPWLTTAQREDVERVYSAERTAESRAMLVRISARALQLRGEYTERYRRLRARCVAAAVLCAGAAGGACGVLGYLAR
ncbi:hypothetical protein ACIOEZ_18960 [Streptomyces sp. NPDC087866]|uniref:hypothetical protein n=1 Tax=unclassified Streptomyces TaxID=2593676 RepID=UPI0011CD84B1|nr:MULTISPECIES: hypothetical protein [unclassified Streptomyces]MCX4450904.1 hypothetical protein [Streptomyces sp. NBC_01789]TXS07111.1 hypothetical protein EAO73_00190 [Streptomyces sp. col6]